MEEKAMTRTNSEPPTSESSEITKAVSTIDEFRKNDQLSIEKALDGKQLSYYRRENKKQLAAVIMTWLGEMCEAFNLENKPNAIQLANIAQALIREYWGLKLDEIAVFCEKAKCGDFGKVYNRIDQAVIFEWLDKYLEQRDAVLETKRNTTPTEDENIEANAVEVVKGPMNTFPDEYKPAPNTGNRLRDALLDPKFRKFQVDYELNSPHQKELRKQREELTKKEEKENEPTTGINT